MPDAFSARNDRDGIESPIGSVIDNRADCLGQS